MSSHHMVMGNILGALAFASIVEITGARADTVAEWKFDPKADLAGGASVPIDTVRAGASWGAVE